MQQRKLRHLLIIAKGIIGKCWTIIGRCRVIWQRGKLIRFLLLPIGIICVLVIMLVVPFSYTPNTSVPFPYIPPSPKGYHIEMTLYKLDYLLSSGYVSPLMDIGQIIGESLIFKNVLITTETLVTRKIQPYIPGKGLAGWETETFLLAGLVQFVPQDPSGLRDIRVGDVVDIIGICTGMSAEWPVLVVMKNCQFLPAGVAPLPLPGGPAIVTGGY